MIKKINFKNKLYQWKNIVFEHISDYDCRVTFEDSKKNFTLLNSINNGSKYDTPFVYLISNEENVMILGGKIIYVFNINNKNVNTHFALNRDYLDKKHFSDKLIPISNNGHIYIYETGVLSIDSKLNIEWYRQKYMDDLLIKQTESDLIFESAFDNSLIEISINNGNISDDMN